MNLDVKMIEEFLSQYLKSAQFEDYGPNGLQVNAYEGVVTKVALSVSATLESIHEAARLKANILLTHHGLFWKYQGAKPLVGAFGERVKKLYENKISLISYHLPLDAHEEVGNAKALADLLGLKNTKPFGLNKKQYLGIQGEWDKEFSPDEVKHLLEKVLNHPVTHADAPKRKIKNMGIITGGANNEWPHAIDANLDSYLTGEISEYNWHDAKEAGLHYYAGGHHATEKFGVQCLGQKLKKQFPSLEIIFIDSENPA